jgi:hypothetical protein
MDGADGDDQEYHECDQADEMPAEAVDDIGEHAHTLDACESAPAPCRQEGVMYAGQIIARSEPTDGSKAAPNTFGYCPASSYQLRIGPKYERTKAKAPSTMELLEIVGMEYVTLLKCTCIFVS